MLKCLSTRVWEMTDGNPGLVMAALYTMAYSGVSILPYYDSILILNLSS